MSLPSPLLAKVVGRRMQGAWSPNIPFADHGGELDNMPTQAFG
jgi:hypothetical protein